MGDNRVLICGTVPYAPIHSHSAYNEEFSMCDLMVMRTSGAADIIKLTIPERLYPSKNISVGDNIRVSGQYRSRNAVQDGKIKLLLSVFANEIELVIERETQYENKIELCGYICRPVTYRKTPLGREIADILLAVNRKFGRSDYIPCVVWGRNAVYASGMRVGEKIKISGRIQSRTYSKKTENGIESKTACEVSAESIEICA